MSFGEQMKQKADEVHLQEKAKDFGDAVAEMVKAGVGIVAGYASQNREKVDVMLDRAETTIDEKTGGKHTVTVTKVRSKVGEGLDKLVEQGGKTSSTPTGTGYPPAPGASTTPGTPTPGPTAAGTSSVPGMQGAAGAHGMADSVPDDTTSAFDDDSPSGSPS